jgi:HEPN domain-containing protein
MPGIAKDWLDRAGENLELARHSEIPGISLPLLTIHAQQAAELALKAVCYYRGLDFEGTHKLEILTQKLEGAGISVSADVKQAVTLTRDAVGTRYPSPAPPVTQEEHTEALRLAQAVVDWAGEIVGKAAP